MLFNANLKTDAKNTSTYRLIYFPNTSDLTNRIPEMPIWFHQKTDSFARLFLDLKIATFAAFL